MIFRYAQVDSDINTMEWTRLFAGLRAARNQERTGS
jgi:hypothetical protein